MKRVWSIVFGLAALVAIDILAANAAARVSMPTPQIFERRIAEIDYDWDTAQFDLLFSCAHGRSYLVYKHATCFSNPYGTEADRILYYFFKPRPLLSLSRLFAPDRVYFSNSTPFATSAGTVSRDGSWVLIQRSHGPEDTRRRMETSSSFAIIDDGRWKSAD
jgi:hypothetical protein